MVNPLAVADFCFRPVQAKQLRRAKFMFVTLGTAFGYASRVDELTRGAASYGDEEGFAAVGSGASGEQLLRQRRRRERYGLEEEEGEGVKNRHNMREEQREEGEVLDLHSDSDLHSDLAAAAAAVGGGMDDSGEFIVANCHRLPHNMFRKVLTPPSVITRELRRAIAACRAVNPHLAIV